ncbi:MAG TPA: hypothetical protein VNK70_01035 [Candidatus Paceibacterota bacterium]|nr:hypothetical protein [Candidatus Paceibacterota bacterium]
MDTKQQEQFSKFKALTRWMYEDSKSALDKADARFLVALGLFTYIEMLGAFLKGYFRKDSAGQIEKCKQCSGSGCGRCKNGQSRTSGVERFNEFLSYLGQEYKDLIAKHPGLYDKLRSGLVHEIIPKEKFCIYKDFVPQINVDHSVIGGARGSAAVYVIPASITTLSCGIVFSDSENRWEIILSKLLDDFRAGVERLVSEVENGSHHFTFFEAANEINLDGFQY